MIDWKDRASATLLPLSRGSTLAAALREWSYTGRFFDLEAPKGICELCGKKELRYQFDIENKGSSCSLLVGSECIKRFAITGLDEEGRPLDAAESGRAVDRHRRGLVEDARKRRVMTALLKLGQKVPSFDAEDFIKFVDEKGSFTPKQVAMVFWRFDSHGIRYRPADWRVRLKRDSDLRQLREMARAPYERVAAALTSAQRKRISEIEARFRKHGQSWRDQ